RLSTTTARRKKTTRSFVQTPPTRHRARRYRSALYRSTRALFPTTRRPTMNRPRADIDPRWRILLSCLLASAMLAPPSSAFAADPPSHASDTTTTTEDPTPTSTVEILNRSAERIQIGQPLHL